MPISHTIYELVLECVVIPHKNIQLAHKYILDDSNFLHDSDILQQGLHFELINDFLKHIIVKRETPQPVAPFTNMD